MSPRQAVADIRRLTTLTTSYSGLALNLYRPLEGPGPLGLQLYRSGARLLCRFIADAERMGVRVLSERAIS